MGFVAPRVGPASFLTAHILTWLLCLPLVGAVAALAMFVVGYKEEERLRLLVRGLAGGAVRPGARPLRGLQRRRDPRRRE